MSEVTKKRVECFIHPQGVYPLVPITRAEIQGRGSKLFTGGYYALDLGQLGVLATGTNLRPKIEVLAKVSLEEFHLSVYRGMGLTAPTACLEQDKGTKRVVRVKLVLHKLQLVYGKSIQVLDKLLIVEDELKSLVLTDAPLNAGGHRFEHIELRAITRNGTNINVLIILPACVTIDDRELLRLVLIGGIHGLNILIRERHDFLNGNRERHLIIIGATTVTLEKVAGISGGVFLSHSL